MAYRKGDETPPGEYSAESPPPFRVHRSRMGNLPVYSDSRASGGNKQVTVLRKYAGDVHVLSKDLTRLCKAEVEQFHGHLEVKGKHNQVIRDWLVKLGF